MQIRKKILGYTLFALLGAGICGWTTTAHAQALYGSIYGQVTDPAGAAVPNATVTVNDVSKGTTVQVTTNESGEYQVPHLIPDTYTVKATATGFRPAENPGITVAADTSPKVDLSLTIGNTTDITVTEEAPPLKTDRADVAAVFNEKTVSDLPIVGRNFANLELLIPGAQVMGWSQNNAEDAQGSPTVNIAGQHFSGVDYELDGAADQDPILGQIVINPPLDAVTEAKISTQSYDAEFGQAVAAVVSAQTKSGTNSFHGDVFDYRRSDAQLARNPFNQVPGKIPAALYSQYGGSIGGPILKDKTFFFGDYQAVRQRLGTSDQVTVPTKLMHDSCLGANGNTEGGCDLSEYLNTLARGPEQGQIYNPRIEGLPAFTNNFIPKQYLSSQALYLLNLIPYPNAAGTSDGTANNYNGGGNGVVNQNQFDVRLDHQVSESKHAFGRYSYFDNANSAATIFGAAGGTGFSSPTNSFGGSAVGKNQSAVTGMDIALTPKLLTDFRLGYLRYHVQTHKFDGSTELATMAGIPGLNTADPSTVGSPGFYVNNVSGSSGDGLSSFGSGLNVNACNCQLLETENQYQAVNNWTKVFGNHNLKFGADLRYGRNLRVPSDSNRAGEVTFGASDTENAGLSTPGGIGLATFLIGDVTNLTRYVSSSLNAKESQKRVFSYVQDNWRVTPNLTINLGVRWEIYFPETVNGAGRGGFADLTTGNIRVAGVGGISTAMNVKKDYKMISPRLGIAYQLNPKTVIRAGYGRSFDIGVFGSIFGHVVTQNLPVLANQNLVDDGPNTAAFNLATGPTAFVFPAIPSNGLIPIPNGDNVKIRQDPNKFPTIDAWNLSFEREISRNMSFTLAYVGNKGTHSFSGDGQTTNPNEAAACLPGNATSNGQAYCYDPHGPGGPLQLNATTTSNPTNLEVYYNRFGWTQGLTYYNNSFDTHYNALQTTVDKHFSQGLQFTGRYTWQRAFNDGGDYQDIDKRVDYGRYDDLREQEIQFYGNYELPFGKHGRFLNSGPGWVDYLVGGYEVNTSLDWSSGLPFTPSDGECNQTPDGPCMPNKGQGMLPLHLERFASFDGTGTRRYFNAIQPLSKFPSPLFSLPALDHFGDVGRNSYFGPWFFNDDISILKNIPIWEQFKAQFRVDAFNAFNHISPGNPGNTCIDCGSGAGIITGMALGSSPRQLEFSATVSF